MPIVKHVMKVEQKNKLEIPESICRALGLGENSVVKVYSNNNGYSFTVETAPSFETVKLLEEFKQRNSELSARVKELEAKLNAKN